ncbi:MULTISPECIES: thiol:disulfide interchange protein DsbA/DsbL [Burkholderia]|uniref:Thiol:disulfide interchange protein n=1 Tax=Burkholderia ubonensis TaxID=101571 RepID=A0A104VG65_9BURK|nr:MULTISPECIES: thiol:disulfide interchange protein DsbA/DsbL [Burkholderia]AJX15628.1 DSBA-like thioredoxin domain protein [Burkholderia ubonensis MSMB22]AOK24653.1 thiol:disulfide interchange protein [Burkholderia ubonensis]AOK60311.1 thiol:disulfide interchange protein [Burkholderia ubonensis]KIP16029.1 DSBA-like thioredoxin domain protein [Burkholderia sp. MSHR3999]KVA71600.1 thiol:disulfide interchange protein [Burkholderia ubonensis]
MKKLLSTLLLSLSLAAGFAQAAPSAPVAGKDYEVMKAPQPVSAPAGKVEVIEFFWYGCPHCYEFEPTVEAWVKKQGDKVDFKRIPVAFRDDFVPHSKLFYAVSALGISEKVTPAIFNAIHKQKNYLLTPQAQADFLASQGVDKKKFMDAYNSFSVQGQVKQSAELLKSYNIDGVPTIVVQGKYKTGPAYTNSLEGTAQVLDYLVKQVQDKKL